MCGLEAEGAVGGGSGLAGASEGLSVELWVQLAPGRRPKLAHLPPEGHVIGEAGWEAKLLLD